ncbi:Transcription factor, fungi [Metarhizium guizhouense ARSEF 977]|uniref:Transcription factor, fungi n=1 Tax=Metarhizium guizhouense (strain ARSEF 977) TaxID=1276136 RepID=A0A0B4HC80_METGA|nr:Transcription factor, fungi [Metarhizium guizhouense ARSEF 977]
MSQPVAIAPAPGKSPSAEAGVASTPDSATMQFNCQSCVRKKVKCNRALPVCSGCHKGNLECTYLAPPPRKRRRVQDEDMNQRLARYENILRANGLLQPAPTSSHSGDAVAQRSNRHATEVLSNNQGPVEVGKLVSADGKSRYIDSVLLLPAGDGDLCELSDSDSEINEDDNEASRRDHSVSSNLGFLTGEAVPLAMLGRHQSLADVHPTHDEAWSLWNAYVQNVESLCKILHIPTMAQMVDTISRKPASVSKGDECLVFSIYYLAVFSMPDADCLQTFNKQKNDLMAKYRSAVLQALVNASWLKTTSLRVLQAYVIFLVAARSQVDPHTFWSLTGIAIRLAQRMGLHRDGENLGLPPFEVQMRRRLFWQLLPLDTYAGQVSGTGISIAPDSWDTKQPLNINDDQIYPGMTEKPEEKKGATEMIYSLARIELSNFYAKTGVKLKSAAVSFKNSDEIENLINDVEGSIEMKYLRYCDILNPLHLLTLAVVRSAANIVRLRNRMTPVMDKTVNDGERNELCALSERILETDSTIYRNPSLKKFRWQVKNFFLWDALLCILLSISKTGFYKRAELDKTWNMVGEVYANHEDLLERKRALHSMICDVTLKAWLASPPNQPIPEPSFITSLQNQRKRKSKGQQDTISDTVSEMGSSNDAMEETSTIDGLFGNIDGTNLMMENNLNTNPSDWLFWDQFYRDTNLC